MTEKEAEKQGAEDFKRGKMSNQSPYYDGDGNLQSAWRRGWHLANVAQKQAIKGKRWL